MEEARSTERITIGLKSAVVKRLDNYAAQHRWSRSTAAAALIEAGLQAHDNDQGEDH
jgi:metal-responsive CopG/Arc/MetJ family transcriptional regulator